MAIKTEEAFSQDELTDSIPTQEAFDINQPTQQPVSLGSTLLKYGLGIGIPATAVIGIRSGIKKFITDPRKPYYAAEKGLQNMLRQMGLEGQPYSRIGKVLQNQATKAEEMAKRSLQDINIQTQLRSISLENAKKTIRDSNQLLENQLKDFDNIVVNNTVEDLAKNIKIQQLPFFKNASNNYGIGLQKIENHFNEIGKTFTNLSFGDFLAQVEEKAIQQGVQAENLSGIKNANIIFSPPKGGTEILKHIPFSMAKGTISELINNDPTGKVSAIIKNEWGDFLEKEATGEIKDDLGNLNKSYRIFKNAQTELVRLSNPATGEFNFEGYQKWLLSYVQDRRNAGIEDLLNYLSEGSDIVVPMKGIKEKVVSFNKMLKDRFALENKIQKMQQGGTKIEEVLLQEKESVLRGKDIVNQQLRKKLDNIKTLNTKFEEMAAQFEAAGEKIPFRFSLKNIFKKIPVGKIGMMGIVGLALGQLDPTSTILKTVYGTTDVGKILGIKPLSEEEKEEIKRRNTI